MDAVLLPVAAVAALALDRATKRRARPRAGGLFRRTIHHVTPRRGAGALLAAAALVAVPAAALVGGPVAGACAAAAVAAGASNWFDARRRHAVVNCFALGDGLAFNIADAVIAVLGPAAVAVALV
jgi:hypothetical protein